MAKLKAYPKPGPIGGKLIRELISAMDQAGIARPVTSHILIAISGGADSTALAHLLANFGRRAVGVGNMTLLHVNHRWRGDESDGDQLFVEELARSWKIPVVTRRLRPKTALAGESAENEARTARKKIYEQESKKRGALVFTAHQADDLAETMIWRLFTGSVDTHGGGIARKNGIEFRPLLRVRKETLKQYLLEVGQPWREDRTNHEGRFLRSKMRAKLMPEIEEIFPRAVEHLVRLGLRAQTETDAAPLDSTASATFRAVGLNLRRVHWESIRSKMGQENWQGELHLPNGWVLKRAPEKNSKPTGLQTAVRPHRK